MNLDLLSGELATRLLTTLGHSLWQGAAATAMLYLTLRLLPARRVQARYLAGLTSLALLALAPLATWSLLTPQETNPPIISSASEASNPTAYMDLTHHSDAIPPAVGVSASLQSLEVPWRAYLAAAWLFGVATGLLRLFSAVTGARHLRRSSYPPSAEDLPWLNERLAALAERLQWRRPVEILLNADLVVPAVCGLFRPVILIPTALITGLPPAHLEAVLAHELAHIRRHDYLVNLVQMTLEALLFFNPFVWWISRQVRLEREAACDALAIAATGAPGNYARVLAQIAERALEQGRTGAAAGTLPPLAAPAMSGPKGERGQLIERVRRVLRPGDRPGLRLSWPATVTFLALSFVALVGLHYTTGAAVELLSPQERVDRVAEIQKEYPPHAVKSVEDSLRVYPDKKITVSGRVVTADGQPLPKETAACTNQLLRNSGSSASVGVNAAGEFSHVDDIGEWKVYAYAPGYAMTVLDLGNLEADRKDLVLTLEKGYSSSLRIVDSGRRPIPGMKVSARYDHNCSSPKVENYSGADGLVELTHLSAFPMSVEADLPGYEHGQWKVLKLEPGKVLDLFMDKSIPVQGRVLAADTSLPLAGAELTITHKKQGQSMSGVREEAPIAKTAADGSFTLDSLRSDTGYSIQVSHPGYRWHLIQRMVSGDAPGEIKLIPSKPLTVTVKGLQKGEYERNDFEYNVTLKFEHLSVGTNVERLPVRLINGEAQFTFHVVIDAETRFRLGRHEREISWAELNQGTFVWDLTPAAPKAATSEPRPRLQPVEVILKTPAKLPPPQGKLVVTHQDPGAEYHSDHVYPVKDGVARLEVSVPNKLYFEPEGLQGYWFGHVEGQPVEAFQDDPVRVVIPVEPAGAIYGSLTLADGTPGQGIMLSVITDPKHKILKGNSVSLDVKNSSSPNDNSNRYHAGPLPLGGKFTICAYREATYIFTKALLVDEKTPIHEANLRFPVGETVRGQVLAPDGTPVRGVPVSMRLASTISHDFSREAAVTGRQGEFEIAGLNRDVPASYWLEVHKMNGFQPTQAKLEFGKLNVIRVKPGVTVRGVVREVSTGKVVPRAEVYASRATYDPANWPGWINAAGLADEHGRFIFTDLPDGEWKISSRSGNQANPPIVAAGSQEEVVLNIMVTDSELKPVDAVK